MRTKSPFGEQVLKGQDNNPDNLTQNCHTRLLCETEKGNTRICLPITKIDMVKKQINVKMQHRKSLDIARSSRMAGLHKTEFGEMND